MLSGQHQNELCRLCCRTVTWRSEATFRWEFLKAPATWEQINTSHLCQRGSFCVWLLHDSCHGPGLPLWAQGGCWGTGRAGRGSSTGHCGVSLEEGGEKAKVIFPLTLKQHLSACVTCGGNLRILSEELSVWAGELDTLLLRWDDGWLPGLRWSSKEGEGEGLSCTRSCKPCSHKSHNPK